MESTIKTYNVDFDKLSKSVLQQNTFRVPKRHKYCIVSASEHSDRMFVLACSSQVIADGTLVFYDEHEDIILGVNALKFSCYFRVSEDDMPIDVFGDII